MNTNVTQHNVSRIETMLAENAKLRADRTRLTREIVDLRLFAQQYADHTVGCANAYSLRCLCGYVREAKVLKLNVRATQW